MNFCRKIHKEYQPFVYIEDNRVMINFIIAGVKLKPLHYTPWDGKRNAKEYEKQVNLWIINLSKFEDFKQYIKPYFR